MDKKILTLLAAALVCLGALAQPRGPRPGAAPDAKDTPAEKEKEAPVQLSFKPGLFGVAQNEKDWYLEIPDSLLGRRFLTVTRYVSMTPGASEYGGEEVNENMLYWEKASNGNLLLRADIVNIQADEDQAIYKAVKVSSENPIVASFKPEKGGEKATRIKANSLFEGDVQVFSLDNMSKRQYNLGGVKGDASFIESIRTYPINTEVTVTKTFTYNQPQPSAGGPGGPGGSGLPPFISDLPAIPEPSVDEVIETGSKRTTLFAARRNPDAVQDFSESDMPEPLAILAGLTYQDGSEQQDYHEPTDSSSAFSGYSADALAPQGGQEQQNYGEFQAVSAPEPSLDQVGFDGAGLSETMTGFNSPAEPNPMFAADSPSVAAPPAGIFGSAESDLLPLL